MFNNKLCNTNQMQLVNFPIWSRTANGVFRESILDHVYATDPTLIDELSSIAPYFGDEITGRKSCA